MLKARYTKRVLEFAFPAGTSRGTLTSKPCWYLEVFLEQNPTVIGTGECAPIWGLSPEKEAGYEAMLDKIVAEIDQYERLLKTDLIPYPSLYFGLETALMDLFKGGRKIFFENAFTEGRAGIAINGLVWMNTIDTMYRQAVEKHEQGFKCIKLKIGALNIDEELRLLQQLRAEFGPKTILRVDANGAFDYATAVDVLTQLKTLNIHSIEQPLKAGDVNLEKLCKQHLVPVALDEELIGWYDKTAKEEVISVIKPQFVVLKPSLHGGFMGCREWIEAAGKNGAGWWITSALESNIGLNAIAQYTYQTGNRNYHGLGTGKIYTNNMASPLHIEGETLKYNPSTAWHAR